MFGLGVAEILIVLLVGGTFWLVLRLMGRMSFVERLLVRRAERRLQTVIGGEVRSVPLTRVALPAGVAQISALTLFIAITIAGGLTAKRAYGERTSIDMGVSVLGSLLMIAGVMAHWAKPFDRRLKYSLLVAGASLDWMMALIDIGVPVELKEGFDHLGLLDLRRPRAMSLADVGSSIMAAVIFLVALQAAALLIQRNIVGATPGVRRVYRWAMKFGKTFAVLNLPTMPFYLLFRYQLIEQLSSAPILYFRSFHHGAAARTFGLIVAPVASRYGVVKGLVHPLQPLTTIHAETSMVDRARFEVAPDDDWRAWVETKLKTCSAVVADVTFESGNLAWEVATAVSIVGPQRVAVLVGSDRGLDLDPDLTRIEYRPDKHGIRQARRELRSWFAKQ
jgi:hypothetical protein